MIGYFKVTITDKKGNKIAETECIGKSEELFASDIFYQKRAMAAANLDFNLEKWSPDKYNFKAELIKELDERINLQYHNKLTK